MLEGTDWVDSASLTCDFSAVSDIVGAVRHVFHVSLIKGGVRGGSDEAVFEGMNWSERYIEEGTRAGKLSRCQKSRTGRSRGRVEVGIMRVADPFCL